MSREPAPRGESGASARLALVPIGVALTLGALLLPRRGDPDSVPLPVADVRALERTETGDHELAAEAKRSPLPGPIRALGSALRDFHTLELKGDPRALGAARASIDTALVTALPAGDDGLLRLRAVQLEGFLDEVRAFEASGVESPELLALAGGFVRSMKAEGWCNDHTILAGEAPLRSMFKQMWNAFLGLDGHPQLALSLDERRALYAFYLAHPNVPASARDAIAQARRGAHDGRACEAADDAERVAVESRRLERIAQIASFDPAYPTDYAKGVVNLRRGRFGLAADALRAWVRDHPDGPLTLRAHTFLRAALAGERME